MVAVATRFTAEAKARLVTKGDAPAFSGSQCTCAQGDFTKCMYDQTLAILQGHRVEVKALNYFLDALAFCALEKTCDPNATASYFGDIMLGFMQNNCPYFESEKK
jgi:hypothetical protein